MTIDDEHASKPVRDYGPVAKYYPARIPYAPRFFSVIAETLGLSKENFVLDLGCGTGELAVGLAPHCGSVLGIDRSREMLAMRRSAPANVRLMEADLNSGAVQISERADLVTIGRALHYLKPETLLPLVQAATKPSASVLICNSRIHRATPWVEPYNALVSSYVERIKHPDFYGAHFFEGSEWRQERRPWAATTIRWSFDDVLSHTFSFPRYADVLLQHDEEFSNRLRDVLKPYCATGDRLDVEVLSEGVVYRRFSK